MTMKHKLRSVLRQTRRGSALIITLGILSLLLIVCMVFAFDARSQRKAAFNHAAAMRARLINESGFKRATSILDDLLGQITTNNVFINPSARFFPSPGSGDWAGTRYLPNLGAGSSFTDGIDSAYATNFSTGSGSFDYTTDTDLFTVDVTDSATWSNVEVDSVIGSYTYLIIDKTGQLDPGYLGLTNPAAYADLTGSIDDIDLNDAGILASDYIVDTQTCFGIADYFRNAKAPSSSAALGLIFPGSHPEKEEFWNVNYVNDGAGKVCYDTEIFERMDITLVGNGITAVELYNFLLTGDSSVDGNTNTDSSQSLWLQGLDEYISKPATNPVTKVTAISPTEARKLAAQLALNMVDAADADSNGSVAVVNSDDTVSFPGDLSSFVPSSAKGSGEKGVLYGVESAILENISIFVDFTSHYETSAGSGIYRADGTVTIDLSVYSPMSETLTTPEVRIQLDYDFGGTASGTPTPALTGTPVSGSHYTFTGSFAFTGAASDAAQTCTVTKFAVTELQIINNGQVCRKYPMFARGATDGHSTFMTLSGFCVNVSTNDLQYMAQMRALDPFFYERDIASTDFSVLWEQKEYDSGTGDYVMKDTSLPKVPMAAPTFYYNTQDYSDARCLNAAFTRVGELGRIHSPHHDKKSLRFWVANSAAADGDWHDAYLLDMFKSGDSTESRKININTSSSSICNAIAELTGFVPPALVPAPGTLTAAEKTAFNSNLRAFTSREGFIHRGDINKIFDSSHPAYTAPIVSDIKEDDKADNAIATFIELLGTRHNYYHIITASRSIKDLGPIPAVVAEARGAVQISATNYGEVEGQFKTLSEVYRDAWKRDTKVLRTNVLEE